MSEPLCSPDAKTIVIWDYKTCPIPTGFEAVSADKIKGTIRMLDCNGPVLIKVYGSSLIISNELKQTLESTGIVVTLVPNGPAATNIMILDAYAWAMENPPPSNVMFITGNEDFTDVMGYLKSKGHVTLLIFPRG